MVLPPPHLFLKIYLSIIIKITASFTLLFFLKMAASAAPRTTTSRYSHSNKPPIPGVLGRNTHSAARPTVLAIFTSLETMPLTMSTKHRRRSCWAGRRRARGRPGLSTAHAASAVAVLVDAHAFGGRGHAGLGVCRGRASPASPASRPLLEVKRGKTNVCPLDAHTPPRRPSDPPRGVGGVSSGHANARGGAGRRGTRPPPHVHGPCRCHCRCVPARWSTEHVSKQELRGMQVPLGDLEGRRTDAVEHAGDGAAAACGPRGDLEARWERFVFGRKRPFSFVLELLELFARKSSK